MAAVYGTSACYISEQQMLHHMNPFEAAVNPGQVLGLNHSCKRVFDHLDNGHRGAPHGTGK